MPSTKEYTLDCSQLCTVLEAMKTLSVAAENIKCADENIIIQMGKEDKKTIVATHFPYSCVPEGEYLIVSQNKSDKVEEVQEHFDKTVLPEDAYVVFYIDTVEGKNTPKRGLFRSKTIKDYKSLCVYGEKGITVKEALKRDGRFVGDLDKFELSDNDNPNIFTVPSQSVNNLHEKTFKICRPRKKQVSGEQAAASILDVENKSGRSVKEAIEQSGSTDIEEIYDLLQQQFPDLKEWMKSRFPGDSYQKKLNLRKENFGKIQQSFSEVHRLKKLLNRGKSVCKIIVQNVCTGTGFVLFDDFIITNAHLFNGCREGNKLQEHISVFVVFNYDDPEPDTKYFYFTTEKLIVDFGVELDYTILKLKPDGKKSNQNTNTGKITVPPGLLNKIGPQPENGEACLIGHPAGGVKKIDPTCIIDPDKRGQAVQDHLAKYQQYSIVIVQSVLQQLEKQGIGNIMMGGEKENVATYHTFMYHGASGSPVFDAHGRLFGMHTAGYAYDLPEHELGDPKEGYMIEFAQPLISIFQRFVQNLKESGNETLLTQVENAAAGNKYLTDILQIVPMEVDLPSQMESGQ